MKKCIKRGFIKIHPNIFIMKSFNTSEPFGNFELMDLTVGINWIEGISVAKTINMETFSWRMLYAAGD